jgi:asparagine synthase (glutamine-hydrolysing)
MCGICGFVHSEPGAAVDREMLKRMTDIVRHRGPDSDGYHVAPGVALGFRRLSIIDLETGDQPISNEDGTVTVVCNGEIYNYKELRRALVGRGHRFSTMTDVEVIVHLYEDFGVECLKHLRGMFGLALWDGRARRLMLARDRLGIKPLHYAFDGDTLWFGSEQKSILISGRIERLIDHASLHDLFSFGFLTGESTLFSGVRRVLPGHYLLFEKGAYSEHSYWDLDFPTGSRWQKMSEGEWAEALLAELEESVRLHMRSDVEVGAWLSPGIDSSGVVSLMSRLLDRPVHSFSMAFEDPEADELRTHRTLDKYPGYEIHNRQVVFRAEDFSRLPDALWHCEEPFTGGLEIIRMLLSEATSGSVKVVMAGEGSDEVLGGYPRFFNDRVLRPLSGLPLSMRRLIVNLPFIRKRWPRACQILLSPRVMSQERFTHYTGPLKSEEAEDKLFTRDISQAIRAGVSSRDEPTLPDGFHDWHSFVQLQYQEMKTRLPGSVIQQLDRTSMAHSLEVRVPFLDHKLVEFCSRIPPRLKMKGFREKYILRRALEGRIPPEIAWRKKRGLMAPFERWLGEDLPEFAEVMLSEERLREKGYFDPAFVRHMLARKREGVGTYGRLIMAVLGVQLWDELFLKGAGFRERVAPADTIRTGQKLVTDDTVTDKTVPKGG